jgi:hypothetical protein
VKSSNLLSRHQSVSGPRPQESDYLSDWFVFSSAEIVASINKQDLLKQACKADSGAAGFRQPQNRALAA